MARGDPFVASPITSSDIRNHIRANISTGAGLGDNAYIVPDGDYSGGDLIDAPHPATGGQFNGYVLLRPQTQGGATIHCDPPGTSVAGLTANGDLTFNYTHSTATSGGTSSGVILIGFKFSNGLVEIDAPDIHLWYCENTFPQSAWSSESGFSAGTSWHFTNEGLNFGFGATNCSARGHYQHDSGIGPNIKHGVSGITLEGWHTANIGNTGSGTPWDRVHPDSLQAVNGGYTNVTLTDFDLAPGSLGFGLNFQNAANNGVTATDCTGIVLQRGWVHGAGGFGLEFVSFNGDASPHIISGSMTDIHSWGNGPGGNLASYQFIEDVQDHGQITYDINSYPLSSRINFSTSNCDTLTDVSSGGTVPSPYTNWLNAAGHAYGDVVAFFTALGWPR